MPNSFPLNSKSEAQSPKETTAEIVHTHKISIGTLLSIQHRIARNTDHHRMSMCARYAIRTPWSAPTIEGYNGRVRVKGTVLCRGSMCPLCSTIRSKKQADELERMITYLVPKGWILYFLTFTKSKCPNIKNSYLANREAVKNLNQYARNQKKKHGVETIRYSIMEDTYSKEPLIYGKGEDATRITTAHNHVHSLYAFPPHSTKQDRERMLQGITRTWKTTMKKHGSWVSKKGIDVKLIDDSIFTHTKISKYLSGIITDKTSLHRELSYSQNKVSKGRSLAQLMMDIDNKGLKEDLKAYKDTINTYFHKQRAFKSGNWKQYLELATEYHDHELNRLATHYVESLKMSFDRIERIKKFSPTSYSFMENLKKCKEDLNVNHFIIEFSQDLWDYMGQKKNIIPKLIRAVSIASSGQSIPISIQVLKDFVDRRPNYSNEFLKYDKEVEEIVDTINSEIRL